MASIHKEILIDVRPEQAWDALRDWGALHMRLVPGFVIDCQIDGEDRIVTFFNGAVAREVFLDRDEERRRLAWSVRDGTLGLEHHNASAQVLAEGAERTRFVWIADFLPHHLAPAASELMEQGLAAVKRTLESAAVTT